MGFQVKKDHNAAICAMEMALLDMLGKIRKQPVIQFFQHPFLTDTIHYGVPVPLGNAQQIPMFCRWIKVLDITRIRVKMGKSYDQNHYALDTVASELGTDCEIRIDPNGVWDRDLAFKHLPIIQKYGVNIVEEPHEKRRPPGFREFAQALGARDITLMACESAPTLADVKKNHRGKILSDDQCKVVQKRRIQESPSNDRHDPQESPFLSNRMYPRGIRDTFRSRQNPLFAFKGRRELRRFL